ncbi:hypothetical protein D0T84_01980 [Dysgonomonas sp. 521]|uniref:hypothetical protein n=1 Tax=Dysgonomonas sp. 521 TaxID=2302932 RepID=UPI0013D13F81|nr:hypothetical protein [Dysgonomonas sp. 521]NDV93686.1 hypothetical protein [Dysgonomonas sp. 521]
MKKYILIFALLFGVTSYYNTAEAQSVNISINIGNQPAWGPVGYDYVDYYYMPDINCYFNVNLGLFYYLDRGRWISARYLPYAYRGYDLYGMYKVVLVNVANPWRYNSVHYRDYGHYRGHRNQIVIRDSRDHRYRDSRNNKVAWYSGNKSNNYRVKESNNNRYNYNQKQNKNNNRNNQSYNNSRPNHRNNDKNYNSSSNKNNNKQNYNNGNRQSDRNNKSNLSRGSSSERHSKGSMNERSSSGRSSKTESKATRSTEKGNYKLASNSARNTRNR